MRSIPLMLAALVLALATPAWARVEFRSLTAASMGGAKKDCRVYFPPSYDRADGAGRRYPVIVFMHGWPGSEGNWPGQGRVAETLDRMSETNEIPEVIALFPDGGGAGLFGRSIWINAVGGRSNLEDFLVRDLPAWADSTLRTRPGPKYRGAIGLSDGGTSAMNLVLRHPDVYGACGSLSGDFRLKKDLSSGRLFGDEPGASRLRAQYSPLEYVAHEPEIAKRAVIYFDCGRNDESIEENRELDRLLTELQVPHVFHEFPGTHEWGYWREHVKDALRVVTSQMRN